MNFHKKSFIFFVLIPFISLHSADNTHKIQELATAVYLEALRDFFQYAEASIMAPNGNPKEIKYDPLAPANDHQHAFLFPPSGYFSSENPTCSRSTELCSLLSLPEVKQDIMMLTKIPIDPTRIQLKDSIRDYGCYPILFDQRNAAGWASYTCNRPARIEEKYGPKSCLQTYNTRIPEDVAFENCNEYIPVSIHFKGYHIPLFDTVNYTNFPMQKIEATEYYSLSPSEGNCLWDTFDFLTIHDCKTEHGYTNRNANYTSTGKTTIDLISLLTAVGKLSYVHEILKYCPERFVGNKWNYARFLSQLSDSHNILQMHYQNDNRKQKSAGENCEFIRMKIRNAASLLKY